MEDSSIIFANQTPEDSFGRNSKGSKGNSFTLPPGTYGSSSDNDLSAESRHSGNQASLLRCCDENGDHANANDSYSDEDSKKEIPSPQPRTVNTNSSRLDRISPDASHTNATVRNLLVRLDCHQERHPYHHVQKRWTLKIFQELLEGVYYIHSNGVMHRDIKMLNETVMLDEIHFKCVRLQLLPCTSSKVVMDGNDTRCVLGHLQSSRFEKLPLNTINI
ncbi:hypothetical protein L345_13816, partial [Ophiophagus hannah]